MAVRYDPTYGRFLKDKIMKQIIRLNFLDAISKAKHGVTFDKLNERNPKIGTKLLLLADKIIK